MTGKKLALVSSHPEHKITNLRRNYKIQRELRDIFWKKWSKEYKLQLSTFHQVQNHGKSSHVRVGDVLLHENVTPDACGKMPLSSSTEACGRGHERR
ncbi:hypothetical protein AVEN_231166-1 [Araneus ventricosus]|uniref:Uncharacterized protein n=1 Tax=Araneus ventricosus TaxID=182803 RepID=A0A4Y2USR5_ARAVE|nr:hypothetical protein AVEN_231166-1 [Araneus ventricosus]